MAKKEVYPHSDALAAYDHLIELFPNIERKGATMPYTSINGNMFSFLDKQGYLGLRLPEIERRAFLEEHKTKLCEAHGVILKEYVLVPEKLFKDLKRLKKYFSISLKYASTLKSK